MERYPVLSKHELDEQQRALWDELTLGPRGFYTGGAEAKRLPDLYNAWLQFPEFGKLMIDLGAAVRDEHGAAGQAARAGRADDFGAARGDGRIRFPRAFRRERRPLRRT